MQEEFVADKCSMYSAVTSSRNGNRKYETTGKKTEAGTQKEGMKYE